MYFSGFLCKHYIYTIHYTRHSGLTSFLLSMNDGGGGGGCGAGGVIIM